MHLAQQLLSMLLACMIVSMHVCVWTFSIVGQAVKLVSCFCQGFEGLLQNFAIVKVALCSNCATAAADVACLRAMANYYHEARAHAKNIKHMQDDNRRRAERRAEKAGVEVKPPQQHLRSCLYLPVLGQVMNIEQH